jgi:cephalosporin hydroxylase
MRRLVWWILAAVVMLGGGIWIGIAVDRHINPPVLLTPAGVLPDQNAETIRQLNLLWGSNRMWTQTRWLGIGAEQCPTDAWITQEILFETKPDFVVECGAYKGGSALLWATILAQVNPAGRVISIDIEDRMGEARQVPIAKERIDFLVGGSTDPAIVAEVTRRVKGKKVFVLLDSLHTKEHVLQELKDYSPLVEVGQYIEVQDTNNSGHPVHALMGAGPYEAVDAFLATTDSFQRDPSRERMMLTCAPGGFLKRVK